MSVPTDETPTLAGSAPDGSTGYDGGSRLDLGLVGRRVGLRIPTEADYPFVASLFQQDDNGVVPRSAGRVSAPHDLVASLWDDVLAQYVVEYRRTGGAIGLVTCLGADFRNQHASLAIALDSSVTTRGWGIDAMVIFIARMFAAFPFRKLYAESPEGNYEQFASGAGIWFEHEGCLREHYFYGGRWRDWHHLAIYRSRFAEQLPRLIPAVWGKPG